MLSSMWYDWDIFDNMMRQAFDAVPVKVRKNDSGIGYEFDLPGVPEDNIEVTVENGVLSVRGERDGRTVFRSITLPRTLNWDKAEARYEHGVLQIAMPIAEEAKPKRIEIQGSKRKRKELT